ncbi:hypothetical protein AGMMS4956_16660 [Bacteroidia bacterium]|nr:hypothetical protein AGMMS4956_16660 [Bacteroidia bacterium]
MKKNTYHSHKIGAAIFALLVIAAGALLLLFNVGVLKPEYKSIIFSWPVLLIAFGLIHLFFARNRKRLSAIIILVVGVLFLLPKLHFNGLQFLIGNGWAICLIVIGLIVLIRILHGHHHHKWDCEQGQHKYFRSPTIAVRDDGEDGYVDRNYVFGGTAHEKINNKNFKGGEINCVFSGMDLDLSEAQLAKGTNILELNSVFGGVIIYAPAHWNIDLKQTEAFGKFVDRRPKPTIEVDEDSVLIIKGSSVFGGGEIRCK